MTLFYAAPWRAFLYTNYLIIYVSVKWLATEREIEREGESERRQER